MIDKNDIELLKLKAMKLLDYLKKNGVETGSLLGIIESTYLKQDIKGLRLIVRDFAEWAKGMGLKEKSIMLNSALVRKKLNEILSRGKIINDKEYSDVLGCIDSYIAFSERIDEDLVKMLNELLSNYVPAGTNPAGTDHAE